MLKKVFATLEERFEEVICALCMGAMATCILTQIILRYVFSAASAWAEEVAVYGMVGAVYMGASMAIRDRAHIRIVLAINWLPRKLATMAVVLADLLWFGFMILLFYQSTIFMRLLHDTTYISPGLGLEQFWPSLIVPFALVLMMVRLIQVYYRWITKKQKGVVL